MKAKMATVKMGEEKSNGSGIVGECSSCPAVVTRDQYASRPDIFRNWRQIDGDAYCPICALENGLDGIRPTPGREDADPFCVGERGRSK